MNEWSQQRSVIAPKLVQKLLSIAPYLLQLLQSLNTNDRGKRYKFHYNLHEMVANYDPTILHWHTVLKPYLNVCSKVSHHSICMWGSENPHDFIEHEQDSKKLNTFCAVSVGKNV